LTGVSEVASCWLDDWRRDAGSSKNISTVTALRVPFVPVSMRECLMGGELTGKCSSPIVCIQCRDGESMALQLSIRWYNVVLRHNTTILFPVLQFKGLVTTAWKWNKK